MDKPSALKLTAEFAYNIGIGAKKHFSTYDIAEKAPGWIGFISIAIGILSLIVDELAGKLISATLTIAGISSIYISFYADVKYQYRDTGNELTKILNSAKELYFRIKSSANTDFSHEVLELKNLEKDFYEKSISKQIFLSDWYAHYKFFWQHQIAWISEGRGGFSFWRDKIPLSAYIFATAVILLLGFLALPHLYELTLSSSCR